MSVSFIEAMNDVMQRMPALPQPDWDDVARLILKYHDIRGEHQRALAEVDALRAEVDALRAELAAAQAGADVDAVRMQVTKEMQK